MMTEAAKMLNIIFCCTKLYGDNKENYPQPLWWRLVFSNLSAYVSVCDHSSIYLSLCLLISMSFHLSVHVDVSLHFSHDVYGM